MGKKTRVRQCPALGREITSRECAEGRHGTTRCQDGCPHDPFAVAGVRRMQDRIDDVMVRVARAFLAELDPARQVDFTTRAEEHGPFDLGFIHQEQFFRKDAAGTSAASRLLAKEGERMDNDDRRILAAAVAARPTLVEIREILSDDQVIVVDLLAASQQPFLVIDEGLWKMGVRHGHAVIVPVPLPHYAVSATSICRLSEPPGLKLSALEQLDAHLDFVDPEPAPASASRQQRLADRFVDVLKSIDATDEALSRQLDFLDQDIRHAAHLDLDATGFLRLRKVLEDDPDALVLPPASTIGLEEYPEFALCEPRSAADPDGGRIAYAEVFCGEAGSWTLSAPNAGSLRRALDHVRLGAGFALPAPVFDPAPEPRAPVPGRLWLLVPPPLREVASSLGRPWAVFPSDPDAPAGVWDVSRDWLRSPQPCLGGLSPRQAAGQPELRPALTLLAKQWIADRDEIALSFGKAAPLDAALAQLGLGELILPEPAPRPLRDLDLDEDGFVDTAEFTDEERAELGLDDPESKAPFDDDEPLDLPPRR